MDIYILNPDFNIVDVCDDYESVIWTTRYFTYGDFELYLPATEKNLALFKEDYYVVRDKDITGNEYRNVMIIEKINVQTHVENGNHIIVTGRCLKSLFTRRIVWNQTTIKGNMEIGVRSVVNENAINTENADRVIPSLTFAPLRNFTDTINKQVTGKPLDEFLTSVCRSYGIGWDIYVKNGMLYFDLFKGIDRSYSQNVNAQVIFSPEYDNLISSDYSRDKTNYKNVALVAGEGEGSARKRVSVGAASGLSRREIYVDSRNSSSNEGEITEDEYNRILSEEGIETLNDENNSIKEDIDGEVEPVGNFTINVDYFLGDIVEVVNEYGIERTPRIVEIIESKDANGSYTIPTFEG